MVLVERLAPVGAGPPHWWDDCREPLMVSSLPAGREVFLGRGQNWAREGSPEGGSGQGGAGWWQKLLPNPIPPPVPESYGAGADTKSPVGAARSWHGVKEQMFPRGHLWLLLLPHSIQQQRISALLCHGTDDQHRLGLPVG